MNSTYRNVVIAAGGALAVTVAIQTVRSRANGRDRVVAQTMTVVLDRERVMNNLTDEMLQAAVGCDEIHITRDATDNRLIEWHCALHPAEGGRLALIAAPGGRGTELHVAMHGEKYEVKDVVRKLKMLLETGEIATGVRQ